MVLHCFLPFTVLQTSLVVGPTCPSLWLAYATGDANMLIIINDNSFVIMLPYAGGIGLPAGRFLATVGASTATGAGA